LVAKENDIITQQEQEKKQRWERAKRKHLKKYRKVLGYRKPENEPNRKAKRRKTNGGYKGGKLGTRTTEKELSEKCTVLYCTVLYCTVLYCTVLYCTVLYCTVLIQRRKTWNTNNGKRTK
jgi:hypothetical protein